MALRFLGAFGQRAALKSNNYISLTSTNALKSTPNFMKQPSAGSKLLGDSVIPGRPDRFSFKVLKRHYELIPLFTFISGAFCTVLGFWVFFWSTRTDLTIFKGDFSKHLANTMDITNPPHLNLHRVYHEDRSMSPELASLLKELKEGDQVVEEKK